VEEGGHFSGDDKREVHHGTFKGFGGWEEI
jgi:hypothetical protein